MADQAEQKRAGTPASDEALLQEIRDRFTTANDAWREIREEGQTDLRYIAGDSWEPKDRKQREDAGRPALCLDELNQYVNQLINNVRQNKKGIKVNPKGSGADDKTAELRENIIRGIEYESRAQQAYICALENAAQRGYGFLMVEAEYLPKSAHQRLKITPLPNPDLVTVDPDALRPDSADAQYAFVHERWTYAKFRKRFKDALIRDFDAEMANKYPQWLGAEYVTLANYWRIEYERKKLMLVQPPAPPAPTMPVQAWPPMAQPQPVPPPQPAPQPFYAYEDELDQIPPGSTVTFARNEDVPKVQMYLTNGVEILERTDWPGRYIPIVSLYGKVLFVDDDGGAQRKLVSLVRLGRDGQMLYNYYRTTEAELVGMTPRVPFVGYEGQFRGHEQDWQAASHQPKAYLEAKPTIEELPGQVLPLPSRPAYDPPIAALEAGAEAARRAIQAAIGASPLPTMAQRQNQKSGIALQQIEHSTQVGSFHFIDHFDEMLAQTGRILDDLLPTYYESGRAVSVRKADDSAAVVQLGGQANIGDGDHEVTISTGPSFDSQREAADAFVDTLASMPPVFGQIADLAVKLKNLGPIGDQIADRLTPPQYRQQGGEQGPQQVAQMQQMLQQAAQQTQALQAALGEMSQKLNTKELERQTDLQKAQIDQQTQIELQRMKDATQIEVAKIAAGAKTLDNSTKLESQALKVNADALEGDKDRQHELVLTTVKQQHAEDMAERGVAADADEADRQRGFEAHQSAADRDAAERQSQQQMAAQQQQQQPKESDSE